MIHLALFMILIFTSGCASRTAMISQAATSSAASAAVARAHLIAASAELDSIEAQCQVVSEAIPYVSDDVPSYMTVLQYASVAVVVFVVGSLIYTYIPRKK